MKSFLGLKIHGEAGAPTGHAVEVNILKAARRLLAQCTQSETEELARGGKVEWITDEEMAKAYTGQVISHRPLLPRGGQAQSMGADIF